MVINYNNLKGVFILDSNSLWKIVILFISLFLSSLFSASETALMSLSKIRVEQMKKDGIKGSIRVDKLLSDPNRLLSSILIGNNLVNIAGSALMTSLAIDTFGNKGVGIATGVMTFLILVFAEITPKSLAAKNSEKLSLKLSSFVYLNMLVVTPISIALSKITNFLIKILGGDVINQESFITHDELKTIVNVSHKEGVLEGEEKDMITNVFNFRDSYVADVMIPRVDMVTIDVDLPYSEIINLMSDKKFSRIPVFEGDLDNIIGILFIKDLAFFPSDYQANINLRDYIREPYFTYGFKPLKDLFQEMKANRIHLAIVIDEYGGTEGIITMEDLIEEIVGEIEDEYDSLIKNIEVIRENEYIVNGNIRISEINELINLDLKSDDFDTIAGFVIGLIDEIPKINEEITYENLRFIVESVEKNRVEKIRIIKTN